MALFDHKDLGYDPVKGTIVSIKEETITAGTLRAPEPVGATFTSGAMRSEEKLPFWRMSLRAMQEEAKRFQKGVKYDKQKGMTHNWKCAMFTGDLEFIRQFFDHAMEHLFKAKELATHGPDYKDEEGEGMFDHLGAARWNVSALIEYLDKDPENTCKALNQDSIPLE